MRVARPADPEFLDLNEHIRATDDDDTCAYCGFLLCSCPDVEAPPPLVDLPGEVVPFTGLVPGSWGELRAGDVVQLRNKNSGNTVGRPYRLTDCDADGYAWNIEREDGTPPELTRMTRVSWEGGHWVRLRVAPSPSESLAGDGGWRVGDRVRDHSGVKTVVAVGKQHPEHGFIDGAAVYDTGGWDWPFDPRDEWFNRNYERLPRSPSSEGERGES